MASDGFSSLEESPIAVTKFHENFKSAKAGAQSSYDKKSTLFGEGSFDPEVYPDLSKLKLGLKVAELKRGVLLAATPSGTKIADAWTGLVRYFTIEGEGDLRLSEVDLGATNGKFYMLKEAVNAHIRSNPAISKYYVGNNGGIVEEIVWVENKKLFTLTYAPYVAGVQSKVFPKVSAYSIAQELN